MAETTKEGYKLGYIPPAHKPLTGIVKRKKEINCFGTHLQAMI